MMQQLCCSNVRKDDEDYDARADITQTCRPRFDKNVMNTSTLASSDFKDLFSSSRMKNSEEYKGSVDNNQTNKKRKK